MGVYNLQSDKYFEINDIKDISSIKIYDMINPKNPLVYSGVVGMIVFYNGGKSLNYIQGDEEFSYYFDTVRRIYDSEKNRRSILVDSETEYFLNSFNNDDINKIKAKVGNVGTFNKKIYYKIKQVESIYNILEYVIENLMEFLGRNVDVVGVKGMGSNFVLKMYENNVRRNLEFKFISESDLKHICIFKGIIDGVRELYVEINYENSIQVTFYDYKRSILGIHSFDINSRSFVTQIYINSECKLNKYDRLNLSEVNSPYISDYENSYLKYMLPWGDMILLDEKETTSEMILKDRKDIEFSAYGVKVTNIEDKVLELSEIKKSLIYVSSSKLHTSVIRHNEVIKSEDSPRLYKLNKITLRTCVERSITNYYVNGDYVVKETFFVPSVLGSGVYKSELEGKSFYKVYRVVDDKVYEEYNTVKEGVQGYQLLDSSELRLILGRGVK